MTFRHLNLTLGLFFDASRPVRYFATSAQVCGDPAAFLAISTYKYPGVGASELSVARESNERSMMFAYKSVEWSKKNNQISGRLKTAPCRVSEGMTRLLCLTVIRNNHTIFGSFYYYLCRSCI
mmetsp:Transcript_12416/g.29473  ORF Transcript_12416/g.29473 Transcript_12416/m.29473 type:complete len:123 (-) Transcript_12416:67-435(-)